MLERNNQLMLKDLIVCFLISHRYALNFLDNLIKNENFESFEKKVIDLRVIGRAFVK